VLAAPDTIVKENKTNLLANCKSHKILVLGRIAKEKQPQDALYILKSVQASVADATLEFRGYSTDRQLLNELDLLIEQLGLKNTVTFGNYVVGKMLDDVIEGAQVLLSTVPTEGNGMQNIEAMSHGLPVIAYNVNYGPNTYMSNEQLVPIGNYDQAANRIVSLFQDDKQWQEASILASQQAQLFTKDSVYKQWQDLNLQ
jgi:poly(glycerol-phosphate) alpha-glucosyltransferase